MNHVKQLNNKVMTTRTTTSFRKEFEIEVDGIVYGASAWGIISSVHTGDGFDEPVVLVKCELDEYEVEVWDADGDDAGQYAYEVACDYVEDNFDSFV